MIITLICVALFIISVTCLIVKPLSFKMYEKYRHINSRTESQQKKYEFWDTASDIFDEDGVFWTIISVFVISLIACLVICPGEIIEHSDYYIEKECTKIQMERDMLIYRLEHQDEDLTGNELLYKDILEFNKNLYEKKMLHNNPWTSWFVSEESVQFEEIDYRK